MYIYIWACPFCSLSQMLPFFHRGRSFVDCWGFASGGWMQTELDSADLSVCSTGAWFDPGCSVYVIMNRKMFWCCLPLFSFLLISSHCFSFLAFPCHHTTNSCIPVHYWPPNWQSHRERHRQRRRQSHRQRHRQNHGQSPSMLSPPIFWKARV